MKLKTYYQKLNTDTITPISAYLKLRDEYANSILLESSEYNIKSGNYSFICCRPISTFQIRNNSIEIQDKHNLITKTLAGTCVTTELSNYISKFETDNIEVDFPYSAVFGYTSFSAIPHFEDIVLNQNKTTNIPEVFYSFYSILLVFDHEKNTLHIISFETNINSAKTNAQNFCTILLNTKVVEYNFESIGQIESTCSDSKFLHLIETAKQHCKIGDVFQLVLSKRFTQNFIGDEFNVYRALRQINPSPYMFYFDFGSHKLFGSSPEAQMVIKHNIAEIHPIAGTYKRTNNLMEDSENIIKLNNDPKETAEHMMLVDLARNDLSKCCTEVNVASLKETHLYSHVIHLVSIIKGKLKDTTNPIDVFYKSFPAGTLSGAPKYKAMELISSLESHSRDFYGGSIGYFETNGNINHAILIRSFLSIGNQLHFQAGAGIVINSNPAKELEEVHNKLNALKKAIIDANNINIIPNFTNHESISAR